MSELQILFPKPVVVRLGGRPVSIKPVEFQHFEAFGAAAGGVINLLASATPDQIYAYAKQSGALTTVLGSCTSLTRWRIRRLPAAVAVELMVHVITVNADFFDQALGRMARQLAGAGSHSR